MNGKQDPCNPGSQRPEDNPGQQYPPQQPGYAQPGQQYQPPQGQYPSPQQQYPPPQQQQPPQQQPPQQQYPPPQPPKPEPPQQPPKQPPKPEPPKPPGECKGVVPPEDPGGSPPKPPSDKDCTPKDPCEEYYKTHDCSDPCKCPDRPAGTQPLEGKTIRQQLDAIEALLGNPNPDIAKATDVLKADFTALETEYKALNDTVAAFEKDRADIECTFNTKARLWFEKIQQHCDSINCDVTKQDIKEAYERGKRRQHEACCKSLANRYAIIARTDCQAQAENRAKEAADDVALLKELNKIFLARLAKLGELFKQASEAADKRRPKLACALTTEFNGLWRTLFQVETWCFRRKNCCICCPKCDLLPDTLPCWTVERYRAELEKALKALIAAKHDRYLWNVRWQQMDAEQKRFDEECKRATENREARFLAEAQEARDCPAPTNPTSPTNPNSPDDCGCGKHHKGE